MSSQKKEWTALRIQTPAGPKSIPGSGFTCNEGRGEGVDFCPFGFTQRTEAEEFVGRTQQRVWAVGGAVGAARSQQRGDEERSDLERVGTRCRKFFDGHRIGG